ncbi:MAG: glycosyltransferase family 2 protein [Bacteroidales bacterium]|nr:glycosyltransferase family 2 protein [Bacteroidales bacterium]
MDNQNKLSAVIITFNEEKNIGRCLDSIADVADEIIVVDSFSTDQTESICKKYNVIFIRNPFEGHIEQKNFAMKQATYDYILSLDADEVLSEELKQSILQAKSDFTYDAYTFNRLTNYCGKWINHCGWYPDKKLRLLNKHKGKWGGENPHDKIIVGTEDRVKQLSGDLLHYSYNNVREHFKQIQLFTDINSRAAFNKGKKTSIAGILLRPSFCFFRDYFLKTGFLDGYYGLVICLNSAYANFLKYLKLHELNRGKLGPK